MATLERCVLPRKDQVADWDHSSTTKRRLQDPGAGHNIIVDKQNASGAHDLQRRETIISTRRRSRIHVKRNRSIRFALNGKEELRRLTKERRYGEHSYFRIKTNEHFEWQPLTTIGRQHHGKTIFDTPFVRFCGRRAAAHICYEWRKNGASVTSIPPARRAVSAASVVHL